MNKKGIFFTAMALVVVTLLLLTYRPKTIEIDAEKNRIDLVRIDIANNFVGNLNEGYIVNAARVAGYRALRAMCLLVNQTEGYIPDLDSTFSEIFVKGTNHGNPVLGMEDYSLNKTLSKIGNLSEEFLKIKVDFNFSSVEAELFQNNLTGPKQVGLKFSIGYYINATIASWNKTTEFETMVPIEYLYDPIYRAEYGKNKSIIFPTFEVNYTKNQTSLRTFIRKTLFLHSKNIKAPDFLMRLQGIAEVSECCGIESALNPKELMFTKMYNMTYIDFCNSTKLLCTPDSGHGSLYPVEGITTYASGTEFYGFMLDATNYVALGVGDE